MKIDEKLYDSLLFEARKSQRKRAHQNLHSEFDEPVQRVCIGLVRGTYVRPHHHSQSNKWELILALRGSLGIVVFDGEGRIKEKQILTPGGAIAGMELIPGTWHTVYPHTEEAVILEIKEGPYVPFKEQDFAQWAPREGDVGVPVLLEWIQDARIGEKFSAPHI